MSELFKSYFATSNVKHFIRLIQQTSYVESFEHCIIMTQKCSM